MSNGKTVEALADKAQIGMTADDLAKEFKEHSVAEFFKKNRQMLGLTGKIKTLTVIVHEYVSNALDACEEAKILPEIEVKLSEIGDEYYEMYVRDNGPGLNKETVGKALGQLLAGTKFHRLIQQRGQQGIGAAGCTMFSQITTGKPIQVISGTGKGKAFKCDLTIDPKINEPKIMNLEYIDKPFQGVAIKAKFKEVKYQKSDQSPLEYLRRTAIANPHAKISFTEPDGTTTVFDRSNKEIPKRPVPIAPHPKGVTIDELVTMAKYTKSRKVSSFLKEELDRMGDKSIEEIAKAVDFDLNTDPKKLNWEQCEEIVKQFKKMTFIAPRLDSLIPIGEDRIKKSIKSIVEPEFLEVVERKPSVYKGGFPFCVEVGIGYGGNAGRAAGVDEEGRNVWKSEVMRFANRTPLLFDTGGCALNQAVQSIDWKRYGVRDFENSPLTIFIHLLSVHIPYTGAGKQAVSPEEEIMEEIRLALMEAGRKIYRFIGFQRRMAEKEAKKKMYYKYATELAIAVAEMTGKDKADIEKKLHDIVLKHLKIEEAKEKAEEKKWDTISEDKIEKDFEKTKEKEKKKALKGKKKSDED
ncbi:MAG: DNA topoisomerase VI subunit B [Candidatus Diapherotrites archaeon]|nr:DNA topoisomerase VI subunit B [Candidatus Diapherotrites archaeon]